LNLLHYKEYTDEELMLLYQKNSDVKIFDELVIRYKERIINFVYKYTNNISDAEDLTQDSFIKLYRYRDKYRDVAKFSTWFYTIVINTVRNKYNKEKNYTSIDIENVNEYELQTDDQKTAANTYQMTYDIVNGGGTTLFAAPPAAKTLAFNSLNGNLVSVDGSTSDLSFEVNLPANRIQFTMDLKSLSENNSATSISTSANQPTDIFNTLKQISNDLRNGIIPTDDQITAVEKFNSRITAKQSEVGNIINQISTLESMLEQQNFNLQELAQNENGVDLARAVVDLQNQDFLLQVSQKIGAMILPKTLLDYL